MVGMTYEQLLDFFGSQSKAADAIDVNQSSVSLWKDAGIPPLRQLHIERITFGKLKADEVKRKRAAA